jgi:hypothetical protein
MCARLPSTVSLGWVFEIVVSLSALGGGPHVAGEFFRQSTAGCGLLWRTQPETAWHDHCVVAIDVTLLGSDASARAVGV